MCLSIHQITLLIAIYTVVQGLVVLSLNIVLILVGTGSLTDTSKTFISHASFYLCPNPAKNITCSQYEPLNPDAVLGYEISYAVLHGLWLAGAVVLLTQLCKKKGWPDYVLWLISCSLLIILDTVTGVFYSIDISKEPSDAKSSAVMMTLISFRGVAFYVLNIVCLALVCYALRDTLAAQAARDQRKESKTATAITTPVLELTQTQDEPVASEDTSPRVVTPAPTQDPQLTSNPEEESDNRLRTDSKPAYLGYQADPEVIDRNREVVSQLQQGPDVYRSSAYGQPYPGRRMSATPGYPQEHEDYDLYPGNEGAIPRAVPTYSMSHRAQNSGPDYGSSYAYDNSVPVQDEYLDDYYPDDAASLPRVPPRVPARVKRNLSSRHNRPLPPSSPQTPPEDYDKKVPPPVPPKKAPYDVRPFSYVNPSFRPADHGDVTAMKAHPADIKKTLVEDLEQLKMKEEEKEHSSSEGPPHADNSPVPKSIVYDSKDHHASKTNDRSDAHRNPYDGPWHNKSSDHTEGGPSQHDYEPMEFGTELMTTV